jgi:beta-glucosidase-like glycosyl hydrolase
LGIRGYNWWSEASHGIAMVRWTPQTPEASNFAFPITTGMSFNRSLWKATGQQIAREARAFMNAGNAYSTYWAPVINLARDPRWGRNIETPGEDPYLVGEYATHFVRGFQEAPEDPYHVQASACCKHYVANEMESTVENGVHHWRNEFNAVVSIQDLLDSYMPPFQACVEKGRVTSLMCSYNAINGIPACANNWLLTEVARGEWGFDGYITSDCDADEDVYTNHKYTKTPEEAVRAVLRAGTDVDCGSFVPQHAQSALNQGLITTQDIDTRLYELFKVRMRLGHFDPKGPLDNFPRSLVCSPYAKELAKDGVTQSAALIKNDRNTLPLSRNTPNVVVIGPTNSNGNNVAGYYGPDRPCGRVFSTVVDAIKQYVASTTYVPGVPGVDSGDLSGIAAAVTAARAADTVVLAVGSNLGTAAEGHDTTTLDFSSGQTELIRQVTAAARKPVIVIVLSAVPLDISAILSNANVGAVLHAGQPSVQTLGLGDLLFGVRVPAGRTVQTVYPASYAHEVSIFDMGMRPGPSNYPRPDCPLRPASSCPNGTNPGRTHRFYSKKPIVPFGFGLSYTSFRYTPIELPTGPVSLAPVHRMLAETDAKGRTFPHQASLDQGDEPFVAYRINITNTGNFAADDVVLGFLEPPGGGSNGIPIQRCLRLSVCM